MRVGAFEGGAAEPGHAQRGRNVVVADFLVELVHSVVARYLGPEDLLVHGTEALEGEPVLPCVD